MSKGNNFTYEDLKRLGLTKNEDGTFSKKKKPVTVGNGLLDHMNLNATTEFIFLVEIEPFPALRPRLGKNGTYNDPRYTNYKNAVATAMREADIPDAEWKEVEAIFRCPFPKSTPKYKRIEGTKKVTKPDADNFGKAILDALENAGTIKNDSQISDMIFRKRFTNGDPHTKIILRC